MLDRQKRYLRDNADYFAQSAISFVMGYPCSICKNGTEKECAYGYRNRAACPVWKKIQEKLEGVVYGGD